MNENKIIAKKRYKNIHSGSVVNVLQNIFFNVQYVDASGNINYIHYKTFQKNWVRCMDVRCSECGKTVKYDVEDSVLYSVKNQSYVILCTVCRDGKLIAKKVSD